MVRFSFDLKLPQPLTIFALGSDGIYPLFLTRGMLHLLDRNLLTKMSDSNTSESDRYWIEQLDSPQVTVNPIFTAAEGVDRAFPTIEQFVDAYFVAEAAIRACLPNAKLTPHTRSTVAQSYAFVEDVRSRRERETRFLVAVAPLIATRSAKAKLATIEETIISTAESFELTGASLSLLAVLSCLYDSPRDPSPAPGRKVINPTRDYTPAQAHNALSDLLALEFLLATTSLAIGQHVFVTADRALARFWHAVEASAAPAQGGKATGRFRVTRKLLQEIDDAGLEHLQLRLST